MPTPFLTQLDLRLAALQAQAAALPAAIQALRAQEAPQQLAVQAARQALHDAESALRRLRDQLGNVEVPAAGDPLLVALQQQRVARAAAAAALLAAEEKLLGTRLAMTQQQAQLEAAGRRLQQLQALREGQPAAQAARDQLQLDLDVARLPLQDQAKARLQAEGAAAQAQLTLDLPAPLLAALLARHAHLQQLQARAEATRDALASLRAGLQTASREDLAVQRLALAEAAGQSLLEDSPAVIAAAAAELAALAAAPTQLGADARAALAADAVPRAEALLAQSEYDVARLTLATLEGERRRVHLQLALTDPDDMPPAAGARKTSYDDAQQAATVAQSDFDAADAAYTPALRERLNAWLAGVPEALFAAVARCAVALQVLEALDELLPRSLRTAIREAEAERVAAFIATDQELARPLLAGLALAAVQGWLEADPGAGGRRLHEGLRGAP